MYISNSTILQEVYTLDMITFIMMNSYVDMHLQLAMYVKILCVIEYIDLELGNYVAEQNAK